MKKIWGLITFSLLLAGFFSLAPAEEPKEGISGKDMAQTSMMGQGMIGQGMMAKDKMMGMCMCPMMKTSLVSTEDGGVIVLVGNKLQKYDKDLSLKKEVEIKIDMEAMRKMTEGCPMTSGMMDSAKIEAAESKAH